MLEKFEIPHEVRVMSSSRNPDLVDEYARTAWDRGIKVIVCSTGISGHLAAAVAARTVVPVVGVPVASLPVMDGREALAVTAQMPMGVPIPPSPSTSKALLAAFAARDIRWVGDAQVR